MDTNKVIAVLSDYDGTLCPTSRINTNDDKLDAISHKLEEVLYGLSKSIPICIISSKDFYFIYNRVKSFSKMISCILGMETLFLDNKDNTKDSILVADNNKSDHYDFKPVNNISIVSRHLLVDHETIQNCSTILNKLANYFEMKYSKINIEKKYLTIGKDVLGGITIDWRNDDDWNINKKRYKHIIKKSLFNVFKNHEKSKMVEDHFYYYLQKFFIQEYSTHPFIDIYSGHVNKENAYDYVVSELFNLNNRKGKIIYLGDSENDNPAFNKADISIGINSDNRLKPTLTCKYNLKFENLSIFLKNLTNNNFEFSESLLYS